MTLRLEFDWLSFKQVLVYKLSLFIFIQSFVFEIILWNKSLSVRLLLQLLYLGRSMENQRNSDESKKNFTRPFKILQDSSSYKILQDLTRFKILQDSRSYKIFQDLTRKILQDLSRSYKICKDLERSYKIFQDLIGSCNILQDLSIL